MENENAENVNSSNVAHRTAGATVEDWANRIAALGEENTDLYERMDADLQGKALNEYVSFGLTDEECDALGIDVGVLLDKETVTENTRTVESNAGVSLGENTG